MNGFFLASSAINVPHNGGHILVPSGKHPVDKVLAHIDPQVRTNVALHCVNYATVRYGGEVDQRITLVKE